MGLAAERDQRLDDQRSQDERARAAIQEDALEVACAAPPRASEHVHDDARLLEAVRAACSVPWAWARKPGRRLVRLRVEQRRVELLEQEGVELLATHIRHGVRDLDCGEAGRAAVSTPS
jgi:hypothetical protein